MSSATHPAGIGSAPLELAVGAYRFDRGQGRLMSRSGAPVPLGRRATALLTALAEQAGQEVTAAQLLDRVWPGQIVDPANVAVQISGLRAAIGDADGSVILTVHGRGYRLAVPAPAIIGNIPHALLPLSGRDVELANVVKRLRRDRLLVITGLAGTGKSRLACAAAQALAGDFHDGQWLVPLANVALADADGLAAHIAAAMGVDDGIAALSGRQSLLLLDGAERLGGGALDLIRRLVEENAGLGVLVTSHIGHRRLRPWCVRLSPLALPDDAPDSPATSLFLAAANAAGLEITPDAENVPAIASICRHLGGVPLGVEIGARAASLLGLRATAEASRDPIRALPGMRRQGPARHRSLGAAMGWALGLLTDAERQALTVLSSLPGGFTADEASCALATAQAPAGETGLARLYDKSMLDRVGEVFVLNPLVRAGAAQAG
ncbi:winged helix-turn-helix domain-containing protein [Niveispirillum sp.]|uniref:ATP-binding protein n=1 Tax=Niveispirillum sp. TaxID=1917217 RepID=UPI001B4E229F|nr:winged helix-turn-helix domain-containing protein [Niveispirillum sp.]MBP7338438.1 winged helix-turn-helix domain-containing protein [Niveispirillum sp.]